MQYSLNQMGFPSDDFEENLSYLAEVGYDGVELDLTTETGLGDPEMLEEKRDLVVDNDLEVPTVLTSHHGEYPLTSDDAAVREQGIHHCTQAIEAADILGAETVLVVPGWVDKKTRYDHAYDNALASIKILAETAETYEITVAVENIGSSFFLSPLEVCRFIDEATQAGPVGMYFDVGNISRFGYPSQWIRILEDRLAKLHIKDYKEGNGSTYPPQGDIDWYDVADAVEEIGYEGWITAEVPPYQCHGDLMPPQVLTNLKAIFE